MEKILHYVLHKSRKLIVIFVMVFVGAIAFVGSFFVKRNRIIQIEDSITVEAGQELNLKAIDFFDTDEKNVEKIIFVIEEVDIHTVGTYKAEAKFGKQTFAITVNVEDTKAPMISFAQRYMFTSNIANTDNIMTMLENIYEVSEFTVRLIRFERKAGLKVMDERALKVLTDEILLPSDTNELLRLGTSEIPEEEGIYRAVLEVADIYGNAVYEEIVLILDKTGAYIEDVADKIIEVERKNIKNEPEINPMEYVIIDNVDGKIAAEAIQYELELKDEEKQEWIIHVYYIDRAGNESRGDFLITVKEEKAEIEIGKMQENISMKQSEKEIDDAINIESIQNNSGTEQGEKNTQIEGIGNDLKEKEPDNSKNKNENEWRPTDNENDISPWEQRVIDAGYGNVVDFGDGSYGVLTHNDGYVNGKRGGEILREYLAVYGLVPQNVSGGVIDEDDDWRWYIADNVCELNNLGNDW